MYLDDALWRSVAGGRDACPHEASGAALRGDAGMAASRVWEAAILTNAARELDGGAVLAVRANAPRAGLHPRRLTLDEQDRLLHIRPPHAVRLAVRVTDVVAEAYRLVTYLTSALHGHVPCTSFSITRTGGQKSRPQQSGALAVNQAYMRRSTATPRLATSRRVFGRQLAGRRRRADRRRYNAVRSVAWRLRTSPQHWRREAGAASRAHLPREGLWPPYLRPTGLALTAPQ